jgi:hypothetical protein
MVYNNSLDHSNKNNVQKISILRSRGRHPYNDTLLAAVSQSNLWYGTQTFTFPFKGVIFGSSGSVVIILNYQIIEADLRIDSVFFER